MASNKIPDLLIRENQVKQLKLSDYFASDARDFSVTNEKGEAVAARIENGYLVLDAQELGYSDLVVTAKEGLLGLTVTENVRVRVAGENAYTIAALPDTQDYTNAARVGTFKAMTEWLVANKDSLNIQFVTHVGDITTENGTGHWSFAKEALSILDGKIPYGLTLGNHDGVSGNFSSSRINDYFSIDQLKEANGEHFGGVYDQQPTLSNNSYSTFTAPDGTKWLVLNLEFGTRADVLRWAGEVIEGHLDHRVILTTHSYMTWAGRHDATGAPLYDEGTGYDYGLGNSAEQATDGETMYRELVQKYSNVTFTFSGHIFGDGAETLVSYDQFGNPVYQMMVNYQNGVSSEITGNGGNASGSAGGNGAIRLVTIDPDNNAFYTSTYFAALDDYMVDNRTKAELDRDGLTGPYRDHEQTVTNVYLGPPDVVAIAKAGNDKFVSTASGADKVDVTLDGDWTLNPAGGDLTYVWTDRDGNVAATGEKPTLSLGAGQHLLTLTVTDSTGRISTDEVRVIVATDDTLLVDNFNDGNANGWGQAGSPVAIATGTPSSFNIAPLPTQGAEPPPAGGEDAPVTFIPRVSGVTNGIPVKVEGGGTVTSYTLVYDILVSGATARNYTSLLQTSGGGNTDAELFIQKKAETHGGIGTNQDYEGTFSYDTWHRVAFTFTNQGTSTLIKKYIDGVYVGDTVQSGSNHARYALDLDTGFYLFADNDGETSPLYASSVLFSDKVFTDAEVQALGGVKPDGIVETLPEGKSVQLDFSDGAIATAFGQGAAVKNTSEFSIPALPVAPQQPDPEDPAEEAGVSFIPKLSQAQGILVKPAQPAPEGSVITSYSLVYDVLIPSGGGSWFSFLQTDVTNGSDAELFLRSGSGIGINSDYEGTFTFNEWHRVAFTIENEGSQTRIKKYIDGKYVGDTVQSGGNHGRYAIDLNKGLLLFSDNDGETSNGYVSSVLMTDKVFTADEIDALGGAKAGGILAEQPSDYAIQIDFSTPQWNDTFGNGTATATTLGTGLGNFRVKGTVASRTQAEEGQDAPEGRLFEQSDSANNVLVWNDPKAKAWKDYVFESTLHTTDNDGIGLVFYYADAQNHYRVVFDAETNSRSLVRIKDGAETVLAREHGGTPWTRDFDVKVAVTDDVIRVFVDGRDVFGAVADDAPLAGGTVGFYSHNQRSSQFDNVSVNPAKLTAHAGDDARLADWGGNGKEIINLTGTGSYGLDDITSYIWLNGDGQVVAEGETVVVELGIGEHAFELVVSDAAGNTARDTVKVEVVGGDRLLLAEDFASQGALSAWTIVDEGEFGGAGADGKSSQWELRDGELVQLSGLTSRQLTWNGASNSDPWKKGWSPHGDGVNVLRKGTYALYNDEAAKTWSDYAVEATINTPDNGALGLLFYYQDANNYYKIELDASGDYDRSAGNGAGSLFQLIQVKDGVEKYLNQFPAKYTPNEAFQLRVEVLDGKIQAYVDGDALFAYAIEDRAQTQGSIGLFAWDNAGVSFDNVTVISLAATDPEEPVDTVPTAGYSGNVWLLEGDAVSTKTGQFKFDGGANNGVVTGLSWGPKGGAYDVGNGTTVVPLTSNGLPVTVSHEDQGPLTLIGRDSEGNEVFRLSATPAGEYTVSLSGALDHPDAGLAGAEDALRARVNFTVTDDDGDTASGHIQFDVRDGAPTAAYSGNTWLKERDEVTSRTGQFKFDGGADGAVITALSWGPKGGAYDVGKGTTVVPLTSNGLPVTVSHEDQGPLTLIGRASDGTEIFRISSTETGEYTVTLSGNLDHPADSGEGKDDALRARINFTATDADGDTASGHIQFDIRNGDEVSPYEIVPNEFGGNDIFLHVADALVPELGTDSLDRVFYDGEKADIVLPGTIEQATLLNEANDSNLFGNALDNVLTGNDFANIIKGGEGRDVMTGGKGADIFLFDAADQSGIRQIDHVTDFSFGDGDKLVFNDLDVQQQANKSFLFSSVFRDGVLSNGLSNVLSLLTNDVALATTAVAALMSENSVAGFKFDGDWYVVQTGERTNNVSGIQNPLSLLSKNGLNKIVDIAADHLAIENVIEIDLVGTNAIGKLGNVVSYDIAA